VKAAAAAAPDALQAVRACYGAALLCAPGPMIRRCTGRPPGPAARRLARVLGARHLIQAALTAGAGPGSARLTVGAAVDLAHAASMACVTAASQTLGRATLTDAVLETALAAAGLAAARGRPVRPPAALG